MATCLLELKTLTLPLDSQFRTREWIFWH